jgi:hypothetical protein
MQHMAESTGDVVLGMALVDDLGRELGSAFSARSRVRRNLESVPRICSYS